MRKTNVFAACLSAAMIVGLLGYGNTAKAVERGGITEPIASYTLGDPVKTDTVSDFIISSYNTTVSYGEDTLEGTLIVVGNLTEDEDEDSTNPSGTSDPSGTTDPTDPSDSSSTTDPSDPSDPSSTTDPSGTTDPVESKEVYTTAEVMAAYNTFITDNRIDDSIGIVMNGYNIEITEPVNLPYVEINSSFVWMWKDAYNSDPDDFTKATESAQERTDAVTANSKVVSIYSPKISLFNNVKDVWNIEYLEITTDDMTMTDSPVTPENFRALGMTNSLTIEYDNCVLNTVTYDFEEADEYSYFDTEVIDYEGKAVTKTEEFYVSTDTCEITYNANGGEVLVNVEDEEEETTTKVATYTVTIPKGADIDNLIAERKGYTFDGWFEQSVGGKQFDLASELPDSFAVSTTIYAHWTANKYTVTLVPDEENPDDTTVIEDVEYDSLIGFFPELTNEENPAIVLTGWTDKGEDPIILKQGDNYTVDGDITLYPVWEDTNCYHETTELVNQKDATCSEEGYTGDEQCTNCGNIITHGEVIDKIPHAETELQNEKEATCSSGGYTGDKICLECGEVAEEGENIPKLPHTYDNGVVTKEATATEDGQKTYTCKVCGYKRFSIITKSGEVNDPDEEKKAAEEKAAEEKAAAEKKAAEEKAAAEKKAAEEKAAAEKKAAEEKAAAEKKAEVAKQKKAAQNTKAVIKSVKNKKGKKAVIKIKAVSGYTYQINLCTSKKFKKGVKTYNTSKTSYTAKKLKKGKKYYVRVRTVKTIDGKKIYGKWSAVKTVKIKK